MLVITISVTHKANLSKEKQRYSQHPINVPERRRKSSLIRTASLWNQRRGVVLLPRATVKEQLKIWLRLRHVITSCSFRTVVKTLLLSSLYLCSVRQYEFYLVLQNRTGTDCH